jgi:hypothetical protein
MGCPTADSRAREVDAISDHVCPYLQPCSRLVPCFKVEAQAQTMGPRLEIVWSVSSTNLVPGNAVYVQFL